MAKQLTFTSSDGATHPESYWRIESIRISKANAKAVFGFVGYHNKASADSGKLPIANAVITVSIEGQAFAAYYVQHLANEKNVMQIGYEAAEAAGHFPNAIDV